MSGQLKRLESEQAQLLKTFDGQPAEVTIHMAQNKIVSEDKAYQCFFKTTTEETSEVTEFD